MTPMFAMCAADIVVPPFLGTIGALFAYMMNDPYERPAITLTILWEASISVFGFYIFCIVWGCILVIKAKTDALQEPSRPVKVKEVPTPAPKTA